MIHKTALATATLLASVQIAGAAGSSDHSHSSNIGEAGDPSQVDRVVEVDMDEMAFEPSNIPVESGATVKFVVTNTGRFVHEFNIGTDTSHDAHADEMSEMMQSGMMTAREVKEDKMREAGMTHNDPNSILLEPGETGEVVWTFPEETDLALACNVPGHRAAGMNGEIEVGGQQSASAQ